MSKLRPAFAHLAFDQPARVDEQRHKVDRLARNGHAPGLDAREVEQAVDQRLQRTGGDIHGLDHVALVGGERA